MRDADGTDAGNPGATLVIKRPR